MIEDALKFDVLIVGGGPAGLSAAIRLKQLAKNLSVCVLEKGSEIGAHILSGLILQTTALDELIPAWKNKNFPLIPVKKHKFSILNEKKAWRVPQFFLPSQLNNQNNYMGSLGLLCQWLAKEAIDLGVEIFPGFAAAKFLFGENGRVNGVITGEKGVGEDGKPKPEYQPGVQIFAKYTLLAEGCRGYLTEEVIHRFKLREQSDPQTYGLGIKEIWQVKPEQHQLGLVEHFVGWPLSSDNYGGGFIYHLDNFQIAIGFIVGLDYSNPYLDPFAEMQRFKTHPAIHPLFFAATRIAYGARALNEGGFQSIPKLIFPGGALIGCAAGFLNVPKIKGTHNAMKTGMQAAEAIVESLKIDPEGGKDLDLYPLILKKSKVYKELHAVRNARIYFRLGLWPGIIFSGLELKLFGGKTPWTLHHLTHDRDETKFADMFKKISYPQPDGIITFDRMSSVYLANIDYVENQPQHLILDDPHKSIEISYKRYAAPEQRYCPAGVYEIIFHGENEPTLQINAANCVHCKTCDIKDPARNIRWIVPEGGSGPNYQGL